MPLQQYRSLHPGANITESEIAVLRSYLDTLAPVDTSDPKRAKAGNEQYAVWTQGGQAAWPSVKAAPNGIAYIPEYKDWEDISTTDRFDNGTFRGIFGNEGVSMAIK